MNSINKARILELVNKGKTKEFTSKAYPEIQLNLKRLSAGERDRHELSIIDVKTGKPDVGKFVEYRTGLVALCALDGAGVALFTAAEAADLPNDLVQEIFDAARDFNGMQKEKAEEAVGN